MAIYNTPGVYVEEISNFPPSIKEVETDIPCFIGYTEKAKIDEEDDLILKAEKINFVIEFEEKYGGGPALKNIIVTLDDSNKVVGIEFVQEYYLYDSIKMFFKNGGAKCYIISIGSYNDKIQYGGTPGNPGLVDGLEVLNNEDEPTIIVFPDAVVLGEDLYKLQQQALKQCNNLKDRITICDLKDSGDLQKDVDEFRIKIGVKNLKYGVAYVPWLKAILPKPIHFRNISLQHVSGSPIMLECLTNDSDIRQLIFDLRNINSEYDGILNNIIENDSGDDKSLKERFEGAASDLLKTAADNESTLEKSLKDSFEIYKDILIKIDESPSIIPPSGAIAGIYASVDSNRGVWKAPANISLNDVVGLTKNINSKDQKDLNVSTTGKSINAIRRFPEKGILVWGARTLAGNDNEWRYVSVRRFFNMVEESTKKATSQFVFEPNDANTWVRVKAMIENFLTQQWRAGALAGAKPEHAFYVKVGLGETMTSLDILEGRMIIEIGMAAIRPAEFIILRFSHKMKEA